MPAILLCSGLSSRLEEELSVAIDEIAGTTDHCRFFSHPLRNIPLPLLPVMSNEWSTLSLLNGHEYRFRSTGVSVLHQRNLLDEWVLACRKFLGQTDALPGQVVLVVEARDFKSYERWATSRGFPIQDIISNGITLPSQFHAPVFDIDLALQHLKRRSGTPIDSELQSAEGVSPLVREEFLVGVVREDPAWFHGTTGSIADVLCGEMKKLREARFDDAHVVVASLRTDMEEGKLFLIPPPEMQLLVQSVDAVNGQPSKLSSTLRGALQHVLNAEQFVHLQLATQKSFESALEAYVGDSSQHIDGWSNLIAKVKLRQSPCSPRDTQHRIGVVATRSFARVGVMGNPSDQLHGKSMAVSISNFWSDAYIFPSQTVRILPNPVTDPCEFGGLRDLHALSSGDGYSGGMRLVQATCKRFFQFCKEHKVFGDATASRIAQLDTRGFTIAYETNVPRQVGLAGSSCIVTAVLKALIAFFNVSVVSVGSLANAGLPPTTLLKETLPSIALSAEMEELGIHAGLMDRVVQMYDGFVAMDFTDKELMAVKGYAVYRELDSNLLPALHLAYAIDPSDSGKKHSTMKQRWLNGDQEVIDAAKTWASFVDALIENLQDAASSSRLGELMDANFSLRRTVYGDQALGWKNLRMVEIARNHGAAAKFPGSGGAILIYCDPKTVNVWKLKKAMYAEGFVLVGLDYHNPAPTKVPAHQ